MKAEAPQIPGQPALWYPLVRPCHSVERSMAFIGPSAVGAEDLEATYASLTPGHALAIYHNQPRLSPPLGSWHETFLLLPGGSGSNALLSIRSSEAFRHGIRLLPGGRMRTRFLRSCLQAPAVAPILAAQRRERITMLTRPEAPEDRTDQSFFGSPVAVVEGIPGALQKIAVLHRDHGQEHIYKIAASEHALGAIDHEIQGLTALKDSGLAPRLVARDQPTVPKWFAQETLYGKRPKPGLSPAIMTWLVALAAREHDHYAPHLVMPSLYDGSDWLEQGSEFDRLARIARQFLQGGSIPCTQSHGDFTPWNARLEKGHLRAFDWEFYCDKRPALFDLFHYLLQTCVLLQQMPAHQALSWVLKTVRSHGQPLCRVAGVEDHEIEPLAALYVLLIAQRDAGLHRIHKPDFAQIGWLAAARSRWARELCERLEPLMDRHRYAS